jgi:HAD superfamily hydrolase (TIGR01509 family)
MTVRGVIFDMDGTLVDSMLDFEAIRSDMGLPSGQPILEALANMPAGEEKDRSLAVLREHELRGASRATLMPGVEAALAELSQRKIQQGILTRNSREATDMVVSGLELSFSMVLTREDAPAKPDPQGLLDISQEWDLPPSELLFVGDFLFDMQAGRRAGMQSVLYMPKDVPSYVEESDFQIRHFDELILLILRQE